MNQDTSQEKVMIELSVAQLEDMISHLDQYESECHPLEPSFYDLMNHLVIEYELKCNKNPYAILF